MNDKRTRSDYIREIEQLKRKNNKLERKLEDLEGWLLDKIDDIDKRIELTKEKMDTDGGYTMRMYLTQQKNALIEVNKKIDEL